MSTLGPKLLDLGLLRHIWSPRDCSRHVGPVASSLPEISGPSAFSSCREGVVLKTGTLLYGIALKHAILMLH